MKIGEERSASEVPTILSQNIQFHEVSLKKSGNYFILYVKRSESG